MLFSLCFFNSQLRNKGLSALSNAELNSWTAIFALGIRILISSSYMRWREICKGSHWLGDGRIFLKISAPLSFINTYQRNLISIGSNSLDTTFIFLILITLTNVRLKCSTMVWSRQTCKCYFFSFRLSVIPFYTTFFYCFSLNSA